MPTNVRKWMPLNLLTMRFCISSFIYYLTAKLLFSKAPEVRISASVRCRVVGAAPNKAWPLSLNFSFPSATLHPGFI